MAFQEISKYLVTPGWHQPGPVSGVMINKDSHDKLPEHVKYVFKEAAMASMMWAWTYFEYTSGIYQNKFVEVGYETSRLSDDALATIQQTAWDVLIEDATANPNHAKIAFSQLHFLMTYKDWREIQAPLTHGRNPAGLEDTYAKMEQIAKDHGVYDEVIAAADESLVRAQAQQHWMPGTSYVQNPITP
jgi:hypothetical protein